MKPTADSIDKTPATGDATDESTDWDILRYLEQDGEEESASAPTSKETEFYEDMLSDPSEMEAIERLLNPERTPEEIAAMEREAAAQREKEGFLPENEGQIGVLHVTQETIEGNPERYIIQECIPACKELWKKNIYTFMVSDNQNKGECWIEVPYSALDDRNKRIYAMLSGEDVIKRIYHRGRVLFGVNHVGRTGQSRLLELAEQFQMQDVAEGLGYISYQNFLIDECGCYDEVPNPQYKQMKSPSEVTLPEEELYKYIIEYDDWRDSIESKPTLKQFNPEKQPSRPIDEVLAENKMIADGNRVYLSDFHYQKHLNYLNYLSNNEQQ